MSYNWPENSNFKIKKAQIKHKAVQPQSYQKQ